MINAFRTLAQRGVQEIVIRKSRFIGHGCPVESEEEAIQFIEEIRKLHGTATHNCYAYVIGDQDQIQKQSDDGEPSGTAGRPILDVLMNQDIHNAMIVVTRYFGGIMLGAGGLIRAYSQAAVAAIDASAIVQKVLVQEVYIHIDYTWLGKLENALRLKGTPMGQHAFTDQVQVTCYPTASEYESFVDWVTDFTQGQLRVTKGETHYMDVPV